METRNQFPQSFGFRAGHWPENSGKVFPLCYGRNGCPRNCVTYPNIAHPSFTMRLPYTPSPPPEPPLTLPAVEPSMPPPQSPAMRPNQPPELQTDRSFSLVYLKRLARHQQNQNASPPPPKAFARMPMKPTIRQIHHLRPAFGNPCQNHEVKTIFLEF